MATITPFYQKGKCVLCKKVKEIRLIMNDDIIVKICEECSNNHTDLTVNDLLAKYGIKQKGLKEKLEKAKVIKNKNNDQ